MNFIAGQVQEKYPQELNSLLCRVTKSYLLGTEWDTRIAATDAIESIIEKLPQDWSNSQVIKTDKCQITGFESFSIERVLQEGSPLLACSEEDYVNDVNNFKAQGFTSKEDFSAYKKKVLEKKLGLSSVPGMTSGLSSIGVTDADLEDDVNQPPRKRHKQGINGY